MSIRRSDVDAETWARLTGETVAPAKAKREPVTLVEPGLKSPGVWLVAYAATNESNGRDWRARSRRSGLAWRAVRAAVSLVNLASWELLLRRGQPIKARFVRLGGKRLDPLVNLPASLKGVEDAMAFLCGVDDGSSLWLPSCDQEPGGNAMGVRIELTVSSPQVA